MRTRIAVAAVILAVAPGPPARAATRPVEKKSVLIAVGGKTLVYYLPLTLAERLGYFKDEGLEVEIADLAGGAKALQAMIGGSADMVSGAFEHTIDLQPRGAAPVGIVVQTRYASIALGLSKARAANYRSPKDLKGLKIGVTAPGSATHYFVNALLARDGLHPDDVSIIGVGASSNAVAAMKKGEIDAISNLDPVMTKLERDGDVVVVADARDAEGTTKYYGKDYAASCIYTMRPFIDKYPGTAQAVVSAMLRALRFAKTSSIDQIIAALPPEYYGADEKTYRAALAKSVDAYSPDGRFSLDGARNVQRVLALFEPDLLEARIDLEKSFDNRSWTGRRSSRRNEGAYRAHQPG